ncbi:hypothetical protein BCR42DRAFT_412406 [Absidia repens]|uniref:Uncharacterized protein n=1 Tax=Absidia repens TaxID=90262 RepID=A0A1X2IJL7_9FUNG|nr:hypothetical protein BCR42DRAFT_412406 [Absidia repens]
MLIIYITINIALSYIIEKKKRNQMVMHVFNPSLHDFLKRWDTLIIFLAFFFWVIHDFLLCYTYL